MNEVGMNLVVLRFTWNEQAMTIVTKQSENAQGPPLESIHEKFMREKRVFFAIAIWKVILHVFCNRIADRLFR